MNILYISKLDGRPWIGPTYSVPNQIEAQSKYDNVFWYNLSGYGEIKGRDNIDKWRSLDYYVDLEKCPDKKISSLPEPFCTPDLIIVEMAYPFAKSKIRQEIANGRSPYIIVPRGEFTKTAQSKKSLKKTIGNFVLGYYKFANKAIAIQCLTEAEKSETDPKWNENRIVLHNGTFVPKEIRRDHNSKDKIICSFIGRMEPYQKGLDLLIEAISKIKQTLIENGFRFDLYGSDIEHKLDGLKAMVTSMGLGDLIYFHEAVFSKEKHEVLESTSVFLMPSRFEGMPTGLLEALALGVPALVTTGSNMRNDVEKYNAGWGADNSATSIKEALLRIIDEKNQLELKSSNARGLALRYDWDYIARKSHDEYVRLLNLQEDTRIDDR